MDHWLIPLRHDRWATRVLLELCRSLSREQWVREFAIGCGSLHATFLHIVGAMARWSDRLVDAPLRPSPEKDARVRDVDELLAMLDAAAREFEASARRIVTENRLEGMMDFVVDGKLLARFHRGTGIHHVTSHGTHHRAQALNMLRQLGVSPLPELDVVDWEYSSGEYPAPAS
jgi:uncharacterized damage-inducible protein DinB